MDLADFRSFMQERLIEIDPNADISDGGTLDTDLIQPILDFIGPSPFDSKAFEFVLERMRLFNPDDLVDEGDALTDLAVKPYSFILDPIIEELTRLKNSLTFRRPETMSRESAQNLGANLFIEMEDGTFTTGTVRLYFTTAISESVSGANVVSTVNGEPFIPAFPQSISQNEMFFNRQGSFFYWDIIVRSISPGAVDVGPGEAISIDGLDSAVRVTNQESFDIGANRETVEEFATRAREALTERSLVTSRGASARIRDLFATTRAIEVSGYNDIEMGRDAIDYRTSGDRARVVSINPISFPLNLSAGSNDKIMVETDNIPSSGGSGPFLFSIAGGYADIVELTVGINLAWKAAGGVGVIASSWGTDKLILSSGTAAPSLTFSHKDSFIRLYTPPSAQAWSSIGYQASQLDTVVRGTAGLIFSSMPGGILRPNTAFGTFVPEDELKYHVGGATDIYIQPPQSDSAEATHPDLEDTKFAFMGTVLTDNPVLAISDRVKDESSTIPSARPGRPDFSAPLNISELDLQYTAGKVSESDFLNGVQVEPGDVLVIRDASAGGTFVVAATKAQDPTLAGEELRLNSVSTGKSTNLTYHLSATTRVNLSDPTRRVKVSSIHGTQLQCYGASDQVYWLSPGLSGIDTNNFGRYGVEVGDYLIIHKKVNGEVSENAGTYPITKVVGNQLSLGIQLLATERVSFAVVQKEGDALDLPLVRVKSVDLLDSLGASTGVTVPYALPVLIQSQGFSGSRVLMEASNGILNATNKSELGLPTNYRSFLDMGIKPGHVAKLSHDSAFGTDSKVFAKVLTVTDFLITFTEELPHQTSFTDVTFSIGPPACGKARLYFQEPASFEVEHSLLLTDQLRDESGGNLSTSGQSLELAVRENDGTFQRFFAPRSKGPLGGRRLYPALEEGEDPEVDNVDTGGIPSFAQDMTFVYTDDTNATEAKVDFSDFVSRQYGLFPSSGSRVGDVLIVFPERLLGQGLITSYSNALGVEQDVLQRRARSVAIVDSNSSNSLSLPLDFFEPSMPFSKGLTDTGLTSASVEGAWGQLEESIVTIHAPIDGALSPNAGSYRISSVPDESPLFNNRIILKRSGDSTSFGLEVTDPLIDACGRASYDQLTITMAAGAGDYIVGETVTNGVASAIVSHWDSGLLQLWVYGLNVPRSLVPTSGSWVGASSGTSRATSLVNDSFFIKPQDGTSSIRFSVMLATGIDIPAPGYIDAANPGPWVVGNFLYLYGLISNDGTTSLTVTKNHAQGAVNNMGAWKIISVSAAGDDILLENVKNPAKTFNNAGAVGDPIMMGWVVSSGPRPMEQFGVYEVFPQVFPLKSIYYEDSGVLQEGRLGLHDPDSEWVSITQGRTLSGDRCPYQISRPGRTRISSTEMTNNEQDNLFYFDLEVESLGPGTSQNLSAEDEVVITNSPDPIRGAYRAEDKSYVGEGYVLEVSDPNLSYSLYEEVTLAMNPRIIQPGDDDLEPNKMILSSRSVGVNYDRSDLVANIDALLSSDSERVTAASIMARHFTPAFVRMSIDYTGTATTAELLEGVEDLVNGRAGSDRLEVSDVEAIMHKAGVDFIDQDFAIVAIFHDTDRKIVAQRDRNFIGGDEDRTANLRTTNRVSHFISDKIDFNKL